MRLKRYFLSLLLFISTFSCAQLPDSEHGFDADAANKAFSKYSQMSVSNKNNISQLQTATNTIAKLEAQAKKCVDENTINLDKINKRLTEITGAHGKGGVITVEEKYLNAKKEILLNQLSQCQLFIMRSDDLSNAISTKLRSLLRNELLYPDTNVIANILAVPTSLQSFYNQFDNNAFIEQSGIAVFNLSQTILLVFLLAAGVFLSLKSKNMLKQQISSQPAIQLTAQLKQIFFCTAYKYITVLISLTIFAIFLTAHNPNLMKASYLTCLAYAGLGYVIYLTLLALFIHPPAPAKTFSAIPSALAKKFMRRLTLLGKLCFVAYALYVLFITQNLPDALHDLTVTVFITLATINLIAIIWLIKQLPVLMYHHKGARLLISILLTLSLIVILIAEWLGYHILARYLLTSIALTILVIFLTRILFRFISIFLESLAGTESPWQKRFRAALGLKRNDRLLEITLLRTALYFIIWCALFLFLLKIWGLAQTNFHLVLNILLQGFHIGNFIFIPSRVVAGILFFAALMTSTRILRTYTAKKTNLHLTQGNRESLAAIVGYIGFAISLLIGLLIAGVDFSGLAIIAGALSVGIGFGLQNIVNNFVSGLILLVERPIKPGDRIIVGDTEGHVRRISIRSTHIINLQKSDVIVPNSDLISKQVTNYMLYDTNYQISTSIGIAYGSDTELAKKLLLDIAYANSEVVTEKPELQPKVLFKKFAEHSLDFELQCVIKDVEKRLPVLSEINFAIEKAFRENKIEIAFPQRDIRIVGGNPFKEGKTDGRV